MRSLTSGNFRQNSFHKEIHGNGARIPSDAGFTRTDHEHVGNLGKLGITNLRVNLSPFSPRVTIFFW